MDKNELKARQDLAAAYRLADYFGFSEGIYNHLSLSLTPKVFNIPSSLNLSGCFAPQPSSVS